MSLTGDVLGQIGAEVSMNGGVGGSIQFTGEGTDNYNELDNRPSINGVVLTGNKTTEDLHIDTGGTDDYLDLNNKPKINSVTLRGDVSSASLQISYNDLTDRPVIPDITDLENRMDAVEGDIQSIETDIGDIGDRLIDIASDIATIQATDLVQNSDISSLKNRMNAAETSITNLGSRLTTAEGTISTHTSDISDLQGDVTSLDTIVGNGQQTVGSNLTDAVTQLNSSFTNFNTIQQILNTSGAFAANTPRTFTLSETYNNFLMLSIEVKQYGNPLETMIIPVSYFNTTSNGNRPILYVNVVSTQVEVYKDGANSVIVKTSNALSDAYHVRIYGINRIA